MRPRFTQAALIQDRDNNGIARDVVYSVLVAAEILHGVPAMDSRDLHAFVRDNIRYVPDDDPDHQRLRQPWRTIEDGSTDCKSSAIFIGGYLLASGQPVTVRFIDAHGVGAWTHVYILDADGTACDPLLPFGVEPDALQTCEIEIG